MDKTTKEQVSELSGSALDDAFDRVVEDVAQSGGMTKSDEVLESRSGVLRGGVEVAMPESEIPLEVQEKLAKYKMKVSPGYEHARRKDKRTQERIKLFGFTGCSDYALDLNVGCQMFGQRIPNKPNWAVVACVLLRDQGLCRLCGDKVYTKRRVSYEVVQLVHWRNGGQFSEPNCVLICGECAKVWNPDKSFFLGAQFEEEFRQLCFYIAKRRGQHVKGAKGLSSDAEYRMYEMRRKQEKVDLQKDMIAGTILEKIQNDERTIKELLHTLDSSPEGLAERMKLRKEADERIAQTEVVQT